MRPFLATFPLAMVILGGCPAARAQTPAPPEATSAPATPPASAAELVVRAEQALASRKDAEAEALLGQAAKLNPEQRDLWATFGALHARRGDVPAAIAEFRKEVAAHPDAWEAYRTLAGLQAAHSEPAAAVATLRSWTAAQPGDPQAVTSLIEFLLGQGKADEALREAKAGLAHLPPAVQGEGDLQVAVGTAELQAGVRKEAEATLAAVLRGGTAGDSARNSAAYLLAEEGLDLPLAEASQRMVVERLSLRSESWTLNEDLRALRAQTTLLAACWDTLGWILFRAGKPAEAEPLVRAAWRNTGRSGIAEHLGEIDSARGDHRAAVADLELALAAARAEAATMKPAGGAVTAPAAATSVAMDGQKPTSAAAPSGSANPGQASPDVEALVERLRAERVAHPGLPAAPASPAAEAAALQQLLVFRLGTAGARSGTGMYRILLQHGRVVRAAELVTGAKTLPGGAELIAHADFSAFFPENGSYTQLVHGGTLRCGGAHGCELQLEF